VRWLTATALALCLLPAAGRAQPLDLSRGGPIDITASEGIEWRQAEQQVIARGNARAIRQGVTVTADRLIAFYRKRKGAAPAKAAAGDSGVDSGDNEVYRLQAEGNVHIFTQTDQGWGDKATYDIDQAVLVMTGRNLRIVTPNDVVTARDTLEYWSQKHMAVARGDAVVVTKDARRLAADTLVAYTTEAPAQPVGTKPAEGLTQASGKLERVEAFGHVSVRTQTDTVTGERGVYVEDTGMARVAGHVQITRGQNQLNGAEADVNMKTGVARLIAAGNGGRVAGLVVPNDESNKGLTNSPSPGKPAATAGAKR
jgi:lipopolysaccharide export system protein LptA